uniref:Peptidase S1 domain-containing protein n=1 Tax=Ditylenchus dipsaci TaxID=166011 RepID=A0A915EG98_9BILA
MAKQKAKTNVILPEKAFECGVSSSGIASVSPGDYRRKSNHNRVMSGHPVSPGDYPWLVGVNLKDSICTGSLISRRYVLTAGHCLAKVKNVDEMHALIGTVKFDYVEADRLKLGEKIKRFVIHPTFVNNQSSGFDIALMELATPVTYNQTIQPVCLVDNYHESFHSMAFVVGWGHNNKTESHQEIAQEGAVPIGSFSECSDWFQYNPNYYICAGALDRGTETGDSGGPMLVNQDGRWWQIGVTAFGIDPIPGPDHRFSDVGAYSRISTACDWIRRTTYGEIKCQNIKKSPPIKEI